MAIRLNTSTKSRQFQADSIPLEDKDVLPEGVYTVKFVRFVDFKGEGDVKSPISTWKNAEGVENSKIRGCFRAVGVKNTTNPFCFFDFIFTPKFVETYVVSACQAATPNEIDLNLDTIGDLKVALEMVFQGEELRVRTGTETYSRKDNTVGKTAVITSFFAKQAK